VKEITTQEFNRIRDYIKQNFGISLSDEKKSLVYSRLRTTLLDLGFDNFSDYFDFLIKEKSGDHITRFIDKVTTNHTFFMREVDHFDYLRDTVLPYIAETYKSQKDLRLWCAASSSGEEPYTLQMIAQDFFGKGAEKWDTHMLATDISSQVLDKAIHGVYANESLKPIPESWKRDYFRKHSDTHSMVNDNIKRQMLFRKFNLMEPQFPFKKHFQVIFCRNVMIYFDNKTRDDVVRKLYDVVEPGGYLFIGHSESLNHTGTKFKYVKPAVYRKV
jgi:chemotaxis protein methyltransferase CheR